MSRRLFLERIATLCGLGAAAPVLRAAPTPQPTRPPVELQRSPVAGFQYHLGEAVWAELAVGAALTLVREPENRYDKRAVRVDWQGHKLGYVPRVDNTAVSHLLDRGQSLRTEVVGLRESPDPWERVAFAVYLLDDATRMHAATL